MNKSLKKIAFIIRQPGTANAFIPLIKSLQKKDWDTIILAYKNGHKILKEKDIDHHQVNSFGEGRLFLDGIDLLLSGTSLFVDDDNQYWKWASQHQIPAIAFVDSWVSYWQRFTVKEKFDSQPDYIAVVDDLMQRRMIEAGASAEKLLISGSPAFDGLLDKRTPPTIKSKNKEVLIITDPLIDLYKEDTLKKMGYTELEVMDYIFQKLAFILGTRQKSYQLKIKIHPREPIEKYNKYQTIYGENFKDFQIISKTASNIALILQADLILGMNSILLLEAAILGKQVISLQPNRKKNNDITDGKQGIEVFVDFEEATTFINEVLNSKNSSVFVPMPLNPSTPKFIQLIEAHT